MILLPVIRESTARETLEYNVEPAIVAQVCQDVLKRIGRVKSVSRESGTITGKVYTSPLMTATNIMLRIARKESSTELSIQTNRGEGLLTGNGAQKALAKFMKTMGKSTRLAGKSSGGW